MKKLQFTLLAIFFFGLMGTVVSQDVILKKDNTTVLSKVLEITNTEIKFKKWGNLDGPLYSINRNEVVSISYQNGETEVIQSNAEPASSFNSIINRKNEMERSGRDLEVDGHELSEEEVLALVGPENYETYLSARKQVAVGRAFTPVFFVSLGVTVVSGILYLVYLDEYTSGNQYYLDDVTNALTVFAVFSSVSNVSLPLMIAFKSIGKKRLNWIADDYNRKNSAAFSYQLSPSIIRCNTPQSQKGLGLGITLSMNF